MKFSHDFTLKHFTQLHTIPGEVLGFENVHRVKKNHVENATHYHVENFPNLPKRERKET